MSVEKPKVKIAIAVSGKGRSLENFLRTSGLYEVAAVICSNPKAGAISIAERESLPLYAFDAKNPDSKGLETWLRQRGVEWIVLAGFLKVFPSLPSYENRVINIHPALLPKYGGHGMYGNRVHEAVLRAADPESGATIHFVNDRYDEGAIIAQGRVDLKDIESADEIGHRVFELECELYPRVLDKLIRQELPLHDGRIWLYRSEKC